MVCPSYTIIYDSLELASTSITINALTLVVSMIFGLILGEQLSMKQSIGIVMVLLGVYLVAL